MKKNILIIGLALVILLSSVYAGSGSFYISNKADSNQHYFFVNGTTGNIGIGLSSPLSLFHIDSDAISSSYGAIIESNSSSSESISPRIGMVNTFSTNINSALSWNLDNYLTDFRIFQKPNISTSSESVALFIESTNNYVGIGTSTPKNALNIDGDLNITGNAYGIVPVGMVSAFDLSSCPTGWTLADGTSGTPNLVGKFILANTTRGSTGGSTTIALANLPSHLHTVDPPSTTSGGASVTTTSGSSTLTGLGDSHSHSFSVPLYPSSGINSGVGRSNANDPVGTYSGSTNALADSHTHSLNSHTHTLSSHTHSTDIASFSSATNGAGTAYYQPYYTLIFCVKT